MPEKPEVITVARKLEKRLIDRKIINVEVFHNNMIDYPSVEDFKKNIKNQLIHEITTRGKWIVMTLDDYYLLFHLRMEGKFFFRTKKDEKNKHEHVIFDLDNDEQLRFADVRKFGKVMLIEKDKIYSMKPYTELGLEPWDKELTSDYLKEKYSKKTLPIKSVLLDQSIITGIGNIYADEILFLSRINPLTKAKDLTSKNRKDIIDNTIKVLDKDEEGRRTLSKISQLNVDENNNCEINDIFYTNEIFEHASSNLNIVLSGSHIGMMKDLMKLSLN